MLQRTRIRTDALAGWYQQGASAVASLAATPILIQNLGVVDAAKWLVWSTVATIILLFDFGSSAIISRQTAFSFGAVTGDGLVGRGLDFVHGLTGRAGISALFSAAKSANRRASSMAGGMAVVTVILCATFASSGGDRINAVLLGVGLAGYNILQLMMRPYLAVLEGTRRLTASRLVTGTQQFLAIMGVAAISLTTKHLFALALWQLFVAIAAQYVLRSLLRSEMCEPAAVLAPEQSKLLWESSWPFGLLLCGTFLYGNTQVPMLGTIVSAETIASFYVVQRILYFTSTAAHQVIMALAPRFTQLLGAGDRFHAKLLLCRGLIVGCVLQTCGAVCAMLGLRWLGYELFRITPMSPTFEILYVVDIICMGVTNTLALFVIASGRNPVWKHTLVGGFLNLAFGWFGASHWGIEALPIVSLLVGGVTFYSANTWHFFRLWGSLSHRYPVLGPIS